MKRPPFLLLVPAFLAALLAFTAVGRANAKSVTASSHAEAWMLAKGSARDAPASTTSAERGAFDAYGKLPVSFVENGGQADNRFRYYAQGAGYGFAFARNEAILSFVKGKSGAALALRFLGARTQAEPEGTRQLRGKVNYLLGNDPAKWQTGLRTYGEVRYRNLWPGVDMVFRGGKGRLKYEFLVRPGARVQHIRLAYRGAERLSLDRRGNLRIQTSLGALTDTRPVSYQVIDGERVPVESRFALGTGGHYRFALAAYDPRRPLVIDPGLVYSTYLGGSGRDIGYGIAVDGAGSAHVTGFTLSLNFPTTVGAFETTSNGDLDAFVTKLDPSGASLAYSTYLGGSGLDVGYGIAVDGSGSAYVSGSTGSTDFPTTAGAFDTTYNGDGDAFVTKLNPSGSAPLVYSTFLGGSGSDGVVQGSGIAVDAAGSAYVTGFTSSADYPTTPGAFDTTRDSGDGFVTKLDPSGGAPLVYSTYLGGSDYDEGSAIAIDGDGSAHVTGITYSTDFPTTPGGFDTTFNRGTNDAFVTKLNPSGSALLYSTYLGGSGGDHGFGIAVDDTDSAYVTGFAGSADFPTTPGAFDTTSPGGEAFVTKLSPSGTTLLYSTYLGGSGGAIAYAIAVDGAGNAHVTGITASTNFPTTPGALDPSFNGGLYDAFVTKLNPSGSAPLVYSTYLGGSGDDRGFGITVEGVSSAYVVGETDSANFPTTADAFDTTLDGVADAYVTKLDLVAALPATLTLSPAAATNPVGTPHTVTATVRDAGGNVYPGVTVRFSVTGVNSASGSATTDATGQASFTYFGGTATGVDTITAFADTDADGIQGLGEPGGTATKTWIPVAAPLTLTPAMAVNQVGTQHTVTATLRDERGNPVRGVTVEFSVTGAHSTGGSGVTDSNGEATFTYTGVNVGTDTITAVVPADGGGGDTAPVGAGTIGSTTSGEANTAENGRELSATATKVWVPAGPASLTLEPESATNTVGQEHCVTATVRDGLGNPVPGVTVDFSVSGANEGTVALVTDADGQATLCYTSFVAGEDTIVATARGGSNPSDTATKLWTPGPPATLFLEPPAATNTVGQTHCVTATVVDEFGNPTPDIVVRFSVSGAHSTSGSAATDRNGQVTFCYVGGFPGADTIYAYADTNGNGEQDEDERNEGTAEKTWVPPASSCGEVDGEGKLSTNSRASFELEVSNEDDEGPEGEVFYRDRTAGLTFRSTRIDALVISGNKATILGRGKADGIDVQFRLDVTDKPDTFKIQLSNGYTAGGNVKDGGVDIEREPCDDDAGDDDDDDDDDD